MCCFSVSSTSGNPSEHYFVLIVETFNSNEYYVNGRLIITEFFIFLKMNFISEMATLMNIKFPALHTLSYPTVTVRFRVESGVGVDKEIRTTFPIKFQTALQSIIHGLNME